MAEAAPDRGGKDRGWWQGGLLARQALDMEEATYGSGSGSLLEQALKREEALENALVVDVFLVSFDPLSTRDTSVCMDLLQALARVGVSLNRYIQSQSYPWFSGGDGPVFGVHVTDGIPHLRATLHYGVSVADEWYLIRLVLQYTSEHDQDQMVASCWDRDDGQVLLVEGAQELPPWVEDMGPEACRHRCWIRAGGVHLLPPQRESSCPTARASYMEGPYKHKELSLVEAINYFVRSTETNTSPSTFDPNVTAVIQETTRRVRETPQYHKTAVALPRSVATLFHHRPDLVQAAIHAVHSLADRQVSYQIDPSLPLAGTCHDWIVTTLSMGRTHYAMLKSSCALPLWSTTNMNVDTSATKSSLFASTTPQIYRSIEVKRLERTTRTVAHLQDALPMGAQLVAGVEFLLSGYTECFHPSSTTNSLSLSRTECRVLQYWSRIHCECSGKECDWLKRAWMAGPNHSEHSLEHIRDCPVFQEELVCESPMSQFLRQPLTPLTNPETSIAAQVRRHLLRADQIRPDDTRPLPSPADVDPDDWMDLPNTDEDLQGMANPNSTQTLDRMLHGVKSFLQNQSSVEGVVVSQLDLPPTDIDPNVALFILHKTLKAKCVDDMIWPETKAELPGCDPYFGDEDYDMEAADSESDDEEDSVLPPSDNATQDIDVITNLLESLEAESGGTGPVRNILRELGMEPPLPSPIGR